MQREGMIGQSRFTQILMSEKCQLSDQVLAITYEIREFDLKVTKKIIFVPAYMH